MPVKQASACFQLPIHAQKESAYAFHSHRLRTGQLTHCTVVHIGANGANLALTLWVLSAASLTNSLPCTGCSPTNAWHMRRALFTTCCDGSLHIFFYPFL